MALLKGVRRLEQKSFFRSANLGGAFRSTLYKFDVHKGEQDNLQAVLGKVNERKQIFEHRNEQGGGVYTPQELQ